MIFIIYHMILSLQSMTRVQPPLAYNYCTEAQGRKPRGLSAIIYVPYIPSARVITSLYPEGIAT